MWIKSAFDIIEKFFYGNYENIFLIDISNRKTYYAPDCTVGFLKSILVRDIDGILTDDCSSEIYIKFN